MQNWIADSAAEIHACRLMTLDAAHKIDEGDEARVEISLIKFYAARVLHDVIDRAIQVHGALGLTDDTPLASHVLRSARAAGSTTGPDEVHRMVVLRRILKEFEGEGWRFSWTAGSTLAARPVGFPQDSDFALVETDGAGAGAGRGPRPQSVGVGRPVPARADERPPLVREAGRRGRRRDGGGGRRGRRERRGRLQAGDLVVGETGWQDYAVARAGSLRKVDPRLDPPTLALHAVG